MQLLLGLDVGTTALKVALFNERGGLLAVSTQEYTLLTPKTNYVEAEAEIYWQALKNGLDEIQKVYTIQSSDKISLAISAQGETSICIDKYGQSSEKCYCLDGQSGGRRSKRDGRTIWK